MSDGDRLRKSGIRVLGEMPWGAHLCLFYQTRQDLIDLVVPYLAAGLEEKEFCVWVASEPVTEDEAKTALADAMPNFQRHLSAGDIEILSGHELLLEGGRFDLNRITSGWDQKLQTRRW